MLASLVKSTEGLELSFSDGIEELDREPRHLQTEFGRIESTLTGHLSQLHPVAGVVGQGLPDFLRSREVIQELDEPLVSLVGKDHSLGLAMRAEDDRLGALPLLAEGLQVAREAISRLAAGHHCVRRSHEKRLPKDAREHVHLLGTMTPPADARLPAMEDLEVGGDFQHGPWWVPGRPTPFAGGENERRWKAEIAKRVPPAPSVSAGGLRAEFILTGDQEGARAADLDNLLDPVLSIVINKLGWCGGRRPNLPWIAAAKSYRTPTGASIAIGNREAAWPPGGTGRVLLDDIYDREPPRSATEPEFADWVRERMAGRVEERAAVRLQFGPQRVNLGDYAYPPVKPLLDGLWPVLGGSPKAPEDWRIRELFLQKGVSLDQEGVGIWVGAIES